MVEIWFGILVIVAVLCIAIIMLESMREEKKYVVTRYDIQAEKLKGLHHPKTIVFISDLHSKVFDVGNKKLLESVKQAAPDLIIVGGDMMLGRVVDSCFVGEELLMELAKEYPVYYANGNHEQQMKIGKLELQEQFCQYKKRLESVGVQFLENNNITIRLDEQNIILWGLEIDKSYFKKCCYKSLEIDEVQRKIGKIEVKNCLYSNAYHILLAHNPVHGDTYAAWGADLVLSGHLHGGMIRLPFIGGIITPQVKLFPKYSGGRYRKDETDIIVSRGLGGHTVKVRFMNLPELVVLHLSGEKA